LLSAIDLVMIAVSGDTTIPDQMGVTFIPEEGGVGLFSTNHHSMSYNYVKLPKTWPHRVIMPALFCQQLRALGGKRKEIALEVYKDHVLALISDVEDKEPPILLHGGVLESERPHNFGKNLDHHFTSKARKMLVPIPAALKGIADRAFLVSQDKKEKKPTTLTVQDGMLHSHTDGIGEVRDKVKLEDHPDAELPINVSFLRAALGSYYSSIETENGKFCVTPECLIMTQGEGVYLLSEWQKEKGK
jgi:DNA polymerase III sliding clamp (beta) subunit (PCNA family)